jgi:hypothetical protein
MATYIVKSRKTGPITITSVDAEHREEAIAKTIEAVAEGESVEIMDVKEDTTVGVAPAKK